MEGWKFVMKDTGEVYVMIPFIIPKYCRLH